MSNKKTPQKGKPIQTQKETGEYKCSYCGVVYKSQKGNFFSSGSPLYVNNNGYSNHCRNCVNEYYKKLLGFYKGDAEKAMQHICALFDIYYNENVFAATGKEATDSRVLSYSNKLNMVQYKATGKSYLDTIAEGQNKPQVPESNESINEDFDRLL